MSIKNEEIRTTILDIIRNVHLVLTKSNRMLFDEIDDKDLIDIFHEISDLCREQDSYAQYARCLVSRMTEQNNKVS